MSLSSSSSTSLSLYLSNHIHFAFNDSNSWNLPSSTSAQCTFPIKCSQLVWAFPTIDLHKIIHYNPIQQDKFLHFLLGFQFEFGLRAISKLRKPKWRLHPGNNENRTKKSSIHKRFSAFTSFLVELSSWLEAKMSVLSRIVVLKTKTNFHEKRDERISHKLPATFAS